MSTNIKPIQTSYKGYLFRSRLEARWAVFYDALRIPYEYEPEGYELPSGRYLPDFWLPQQECWIEVKRMEPTSRELQFAEELCSALKQNVFIAVGQPWCGKHDATPHIARWHCPATIEELEEQIEGDISYQWCECQACGLLDLEFEGRSDRLSCKECRICSSIRAGDSSFPAAQNHSLDTCPRSKGCSRSSHGDKSYNATSPRLNQAYCTARSARFEHGQTPTIPKMDYLDIAKRTLRNLRSQSLFPEED